MTLLDDFFYITSQSGCIEDGTLSFNVALNRNHAIYRAHFPGSPITPGVCIIQVVVECLQNALGRKLYLKQAKNVKFLNTLNPCDASEVNVSFLKVDASSDDACLAKAVVKMAAGDTIYAKMSFVCAYDIS